MNLRRLLLLLLFTQSLVLGVGGVDVGNGGSSRVVEVLIDRGFSSERELSNYLIDNMREIKNAQNLGLGKLTRKYDCSKKVEIKEMEVKNHYPLSGTSIGIKEFQGLLKLELQECKNN